MKLNTLARSLALLGLGTSMVAAMAQGTAPTDANVPSPKLERVEVTGSSIKRVADEGALPLEIITADEIKARGLNTAEDLLRSLSGNAANANNAVSASGFSSDGDRLAIGGAYANLRGLGPTGTLVLLNGRRLSNQGMSSGSVDLNAIPLEMLERVEVLKDGASAIYGTDAIGGVINFILKKQYQGAKITGTYSTPMAWGGGQQRKVGISAGWGDLATQGFNIMGSLSRQGTTVLRGTDRSWSLGNQPDRGLIPDTSSSPGFANILPLAGTALPATGTTIGSGTQLYTGLNGLAMTGQCGTVPYGVSQVGNIGVFNGYTTANATYRCGTDYGRQYMLTPESNNTSGIGRLTFNVGNNATAFVDYVGSRYYVLNDVTPFQFSSTANAAANYPVNGPYYVNFKSLYGANQFDPTLPIGYRLRMNDWGDRVQGITSTNKRLAVGIEGAWGDYDYSASLSEGRAEAYSNLVNGFADTNKLFTLLASGNYNPFLMPGQGQTAAVTQQIADSQVHGRVFGGKTKVDEFTATVSGPIMKLPAGDLDFALGTDIRKEFYGFSGTQSYNCVSSFSVANLALANSVMGCTSLPNSPDMSRKVGAVFAELNIPIFRMLEVGAAVRYDKYQQIGSTVNPKLSFKFTPIKDLLFRGSANTGFRAPTPQQLNLGIRQGQTSGTISDPVKCPNPVGNADPSCSLTFLDYFTGGNPNLKPEKSRQATLGVVFSPMKDLTASVDYWQIKMKDRIHTLAQSDLVNNYSLFSNNFIRDANGDITGLQAGYINAGSSDTKGVDFSIKHAMTLFGNKLTTTFEGTKNISDKEALISGQPMIQYVGNWTTSTLFLPWKLNLASTYKTPEIAVTLSANYSSGYNDEYHGQLGTTPYTAITQFQSRKISSYTTFNLTGTYTGIKDVTLSAGMINVFDRIPPFTWHDVDFAAGTGWDPRVADPRGRTVQFTAQYTFF